MKYLTSENRHHWVGQYYKGVAKIADVIGNNVLLILPQGQSIWTTWPFENNSNFYLYVRKDKK